MDSNVLAITLNISVINRFTWFYYLQKKNSCFIFYFILLLQRHIIAMSFMYLGILDYLT